MKAISPLIIIVFTLFLAACQPTSTEIDSKAPTTVSEVASATSENTSSSKETASSDATSSEQASPSTEAATGAPAGGDAAVSAGAAADSTARTGAAASVVEPVTVVSGSDLPPSTIFDVAWDDRALFQDGLLGGERSILEDLPGASIYHIALEVSADMNLLSGREEVRYTNMEPVPLNEVYFHIYPNLLGGFDSISEVTLNGEPVEPAYKLRDSAMAVPLPQPLQPGRQVVIGMEFTTSVPRSPDRNYGIFANVDGILAAAHFYPMIAIYDEQGWDIEFPSPQGDVVYADTSFYLVKIAASPDQTLVTSGVVIDQMQTSEAQIVTVAAGPMRDFYLASSDRYQVVSQSIGDTVINSYFLPGQPDAGELALQYALDSLNSFNTRYGLYPFTEFDLVPTANQALGIEYPGIVAINLLLYDLDGKLGNFPTAVFFEGTIAHEVAHQWFYSLVGNDQLEEPWVDESLTQYATWRYYLDVNGEDGASGFRQSLVDRLGRVDDQTIPIGKPVTAYDGLEYSAIVYGRGPLFFEALAEVMGQDELDQFLRDYALTYRWGVAKGDDLKRLAEEHCACDLSDLFAEWVYDKTG